ALQASGEFAPARYEFQKDLSLAFVHEGQDDLRLYCINERDDEMLDQVVRGVVQDGAGIFTDGLWEGTGHALNGFFFDQTLTFLVAPKKANTVTNWQPKALMPDMETWRQIAGESAWAKIDTPIARLVMIKASNFTNEERVKAWAMVDYLLRWRPELVRELDTCRGPTNGDAVAVEAEFRRRTQLLLPTIDAEWRDYWARMQKVRELTKQGPTGTPEQQKDMRALADAINGARAAASVGPIGYYLGKSADVQALLKYGDELAKAEAEQKKNPKIAVPLPTMPAVIDKSVLLGTADAAGSVASWLLRPGARDLLLSPGRMLIATGKYKGNYLLDLGEVPTPRISGVPYVYPRNGQRDVPAAVTVAELGPELAALLAKKGKQPTDKVGYPVSLHFFRMLPDNVLDALEIDGNLGSGVTWLAQGEGSALDRAAGCIVFVPLEPLLTGRPLSVSWTLPPNLLKKEEKLREVKFTAK
ncbi:MAG TPA: hypothetical protein VK348_01000, partial [Planctomycetota bacterium]|nr:hypothetical protein [Planctomycetota bacterium]